MKQTLHFFLTIVIAFILVGTLNAETYTSASGAANWSAVVWSPVGTPGASDDVVIADGSTVTIDASFIINNLTIGNGGAGATLQFSKTTGVALVVNGNILVNSGSTFAVQSNTTGGTGLAHTLDLKGNLTMNGTSFVFRTGTSGTTLSVCNLILSGSTSSNLITNATYSTANQAGMFNAVTINKTSGAKVVLGSNIIQAGGSTTGLAACNVFLTFIGGVIETGSYIWVTLNSTAGNVSGYSAASYVNGAFGRNMSNTAATSKDFPIGDVDSYRLFNLHATIGGGSTTGHYEFVRCIKGSANTGSSVLNGGIDKVSDVRYYQVGYNNSIAGVANMTYDIFKVSYGADDGVISGNQNLRVAYSTDNRATWTMIPQTNPHNTVSSGQITPNTITGGVTISPSSFIYVALANLTGGENPLPVELSSFASAVNGRDITLNWETKTEKNSDKFIVERSMINNDVKWEAVANVKASVLSNSSKQYSFTDKNLQAGKYQYRLKMIDNDGSFDYSVIVETEVAVPNTFGLSQNYPNPFNPSTKIDYQVPVDAKVILEVYNVSGQKVVELVNQDQQAGYYSVNFGSSSSKLASGVYIYRLSASDKVTGNNFSSIKKMMLLK